MWNDRRDFVLPNIPKLHPLSQGYLDFLER
jgi:hypothetical protein